jgi:hypothetical protein
MGTGVSPLPLPPENLRQPNREGEHSAAAPPFGGIEPSTLRSIKPHGLLVPVG